MICSNTLYVDEFIDDVTLTTMLRPGTPYKLSGMCGLRTGELVVHPKLHWNASPRLNNDITDVRSLSAVNLKIGINIDRVKYL